MKNSFCFKNILLERSAFYSVWRDMGKVYRACMPLTSDAKQACFLAQVTGGHTTSAIILVLKVCRVSTDRLLIDLAI